MSIDVTQLQWLIHPFILKPMKLLAYLVAVSYIKNRKGICVLCVGEHLVTSELHECQVIQAAQFFFCA